MRQIIKYLLKPLSGENYTFAHLRKFGLDMHVGRGDATTKTEAMYFPPQRTAYEAAVTSRFYVDVLREVHALGFYTLLLAYLYVTMLM